VGLDRDADISGMTGFLEAWRRREAMRQAEEWTEEREEARRAVEESPADLHDELAQLIATLLEGPDSELGPALDRLWALLAPYPELRKRFFQLRVVDDAVEFLKPEGSDPTT
jgi:hypothetical protein